MRPIALIALCLAFSGGCAPVQRPGTVDRWTRVDPQTGITVQFGRQIPIVDQTGWILGIPSKLALWDRRADNHAVSEETVRRVLGYLDANGLNDVVVSVNRYDPIGQWRRLVDNRRVGPGWRYTVGLYNQLEYTLLPGRLLGGDWYNPFSNTLHVYSDIAPLVISRAAYAKDVRRHDNPGLYATVQKLPIVGMYHRTLANQEALAYTTAFEGPEAETEARRILIPDYGSSWGSQVASFFPFGEPVGRLAGAAVGHATNQWTNLTPDRGAR